MLRLTTRSIRTAQAIRDREDFKTSGALRGESHDGYYAYSGYLKETESNALREDCHNKVVDYIVWSYSTPIAWHKTDGTWHVVDQKFSLTTSKHQGNLYLIGSEVTA